MFRNINYNNSLEKISIKFNELRNRYYEFLKYYIIISFLLLNVVQNLYKMEKTKNYKIKKRNSLESYLVYINNCNSLIRLNSNFNNKNENPFLSICIPVYNTEKYIERAVLSVINQSFQDYEIILVNDFSNDNTEKIIKKLINIDQRIKYLNNIRNLGVHYSRVKAVLNSKGKYILFLDPDDMILNRNLFKELFKKYLNDNLDIIEFIVYYQKEGNNKIFYPRKQNQNHNHNYKNNIIYQPELKDIIFYKPRTKNYSNIICRTIWNKIYRRTLLLKTIKYIGNINNQNLIIADDTMINLICFYFANNYSNLKIPGYLYFVKRKSMSNGYIGKKHRIKQNISFYFYFQLLYRNIKEFKRDRNFLFYELKTWKKRIKEFKILNIIEYLEKLKKFLIEIKRDKRISKKFKNFIANLLFYFKKSSK